MTESGLGEGDLPCLQAGIWPRLTFVTFARVMLYLVVFLALLSLLPESKRESDGSEPPAGEKAA